MSLIEFARLSFGLAIGFVVTLTVFAIGHAFIEIVSFGGKPYTFFIVMAILIWLMVSYGVIVLVL